MIPQAPNFTDYVWIDLEFALCYYFGSQKESAPWIPNVGGPGEESLRLRGALSRGAAPGEHRGHLGGLAAAEWGGYHTTKTCTDLKPDSQP